MAQRIALGVQAEHPGCILLQDVIHLTDDSQALRGIVHILHAEEQPIEFGVGIVRGIFAPLRHFAFVTIEQKEEVLWIRIIGIPTQIVKLDIALADLVLKSVEVRRADHELHVDLGKLSGQPVQARLLAHATTGGIKIDDQRLSGFFIATIRVACLSHEFFRHFNRFAPGLAIDPVVDRGIDPQFARFITEDPRR